MSYLVGRTFLGNEVKKVLFYGAKHIRMCKGLIRPRQKGSNPSAPTKNTKGFETLVYPEPN